MKKNKEMVQEIISYLIESITSILLGIFIFRYGCHPDLWMDGIFIFIFSCFLLIEIFILYRRKKKHLEKVFLILGIPICFLYTLCLGPYRIMDETAHLVKSLDLSYGNIITAKDEENKGIVYVPEGVNEIDDKKITNFSSLSNALTEDTNYENLVRMNPFFTYTVLNSPTPYLLSASGFAIGRVLELNLYVSMYLAKIFQLLFFLIAGYFIIKFLPVGKLFSLIYLFNPMVLQQMSSIGADNFTNLTCLLLISYILKLKFQEEDITLKQVSLLSIFMLLVSSSKFIYFPLISLVLLLKKKIKTKREKIILTLTTILSLAIALLFIVIGLGYDNEFALFISENEIDAMRQLEYVIKHPFKFLVVCLSTLFTNFNYYVEGLFGRQLGNTDIPLFYPSYIAYIVLFFFTLFLEKEKQKLERATKLYFLIVGIILSFCVFGVEYLTWSGVGNNTVDGVQGRYFLPFFILFMLCLTRKPRSRNLKYVQEISVLCLLVIEISDIFILSTSYM